MIKLLKLIENISITPSKKDFIYTLEFKDNYKLFTGNKTINNEKSLEQSLVLSYLLIKIIFSIFIEKNSYQFNDMTYTQVFELFDHNNIHLDRNFQNYISKILTFGNKFKTELKICDILIDELNIKDLIENDNLGNLIQSLLHKELRKSLAANYTSPIIAKFLVKLSLTNQTHHIIDPFAGSGRLLTAIMNITEINEKTSLSLEFNELYNVSGLITLLQLIYFNKINDKTFFINAHLGDAFNKGTLPLSEFLLDNNCFTTNNLVIMNPPFTRYLRLEKNYIQFLQKTFSSYKKYFSPQMGLHIFALFLADKILASNGRIAAILPAATFYSNYSEGLKNFLLNEYLIRYIIGTTKNKAFSQDSDLKEIIFIADKQQKYLDPVDNVKFITITEDITEENFKVIATCIQNNNKQCPYIKQKNVPVAKLKDNWNWIRFLEQGQINKIVDTLLLHSLIKSGIELKLRIVRGFEMYGPNFFFFPNDSWIITEKDDSKIIIKHKYKNIDCVIPADIIIPALRKPSLYSEYCSPVVNEYVLNVMPGQNYKIPLSYIDERKEKWRKAEERFGAEWFSHIYKQLQSKHPFGHLFIVDKFGITTTGTFVYYFDKMVTASKNFYVIDCEKETAKLLASWMTSTIFILLFLFSRREIGGAFGRLQIADYLEEKLFLDISKLSIMQKKNIISAYDDLRGIKLPPLKSQIGWTPRKVLDLAILDAFENVDRSKEIFLETIYTEVKRIFNESDLRGKS